MNPKWNGKQRLVEKKKSPKFLLSSEAQSRSREWLKTGSEKWDYARV